MRACVCVRAFVRACVRACVRTRVRACVRACVCAAFVWLVVPVYCIGQYSPLRWYSVVLCVH
jgi:hypothetical protein